jgi:hypothetical protein
MFALSARRSSVVSSRSCTLAPPTPSAAGAAPPGAPRVATAGADAEGEEPQPARVEAFTGLRELWLLGALALGLLGADLFAFGNGSGGGNDDIVVIKFLASTGQDPDGTCRARWRDKGGAQLDFNVELEDLPEGDYDLYVTDLVTPKGTIAVDSSGEGEIEFATPQDGVKPLFNFPVFDEVVEVRQAATVFFSDTFDADGAIGGGGTSGGESKTKAEVFLVNVAPDLDFDAKGKVKHEVKGKETVFTVEVEKLTPGTYTLLVGGVPAGELVTVDASKVEIEFQNPVEVGKTALNFNPLGKLIEVERDGDVYLAAVLPGPNNETGTKPPSSAKKAAKDLGKSKADSLLVFLQNVGEQPGALGEATLTQNGETDFTVALADVSTGDYALFVGGVEQGTISADSTGAGQIVFSTAPGVGEGLLDFDVKGELLEVKSGSTTILSAVFPTSVQAAVGGFAKETFKTNKVKVNLVNAGADLDATGTVDWKLKGNGDQEVRIDLKDLPPGVYTVLIDGLPVASTITVAENGKGKTTWATTPTGSKVLLDFDPVDAGIQITDADDVVQLSTVLDMP